jgi:hypothetical protein
VRVPLNRHAAAVATLGSAAAIAFSALGVPAAAAPSEFGGAGARTLACSGNCDHGPDQLWLAGPGGELINEGTGLCLDDPGNSHLAGTQLVLEDCYGTLGEIWAIA